MLALLSQTCAVLLQLSFTLPLFLCQQMGLLPRLYVLVPDTLFPYHCSVQGCSMLCWRCAPLLSPRNTLKIKHWGFREQKSGEQPYMWLTVSILVPCSPFLPVSSSPSPLSILLCSALPFFFWAFLPHCTACLAAFKPTHFLPQGLLLLWQLHSKKCCGPGKSVSGCRPIIKWPLFLSATNLSPTCSFSVLSS